MIPVSNPGAQVDAHRQNIELAIHKVLDSGWYVLGNETSTFEIEFASYCGAAQGIGVNSGTDALFLTLKALEIGPGDEVITVSHTAVATVSAIEAAGATAVLVDIDEHYTLDPALLDAAITPNTRAVIIVHLYGQPADMDAILAITQSHDIKVIEDCAQAAGATLNGKKVGSIGDAGCFSFYPTKNLGALGDGGMVVTSDSVLADKLRSLREYGWKNDRTSHAPGYNSRLDELQAAILRAKLPYLDADNDRRRAIAEKYRDGLSGTSLTLPITRAGASHVYHLYVVRCPNRDKVQQVLADNDVMAAVHYPHAVHQQPAYLDRLAGSDRLPRTEDAVASILSLPMYPELDDDAVDTVINTVRKTLSDISGTG